jgi:hypothetical protein
MIYVLSHRESVETEDDKPIVMDYGFLLTGQRVDQLVRLTDEMGLLFATSEANVGLFLSTTPKPEYTIATFRDDAHLRSCLEYYAKNGFKWLIRNRHSAEYVLPIERFLQSPDPK